MEIATESAFERIRKNIRFIDVNTARFIFETKTGLQALQAFMKGWVFSPKALPSGQDLDPSLAN